MVIHPGSIPEEPQPGRPLVLKRIVTAERHTPDLSVTWVRIDGHHDRVVNPGCDRTYYVIEGGGRFQVGDGAPVEPVAAGDFVYIARGTPYEFTGAMTYLVVNGPAFTQGSDRVLPSVLTSP
jgi:mannose-6-phosphate isomerase-like protein (cupin superfamily)